MGDFFLYEMRHNALMIKKLPLFLLLALVGCTSVANPAEPTLAPGISPTATPELASPSPEPSPTPGKVNYYDFFEKPSVESIRVLSYNVNWDSIFPVGDPQSHDLRYFAKPDAFLRVIRAIQPDVVCLQEINPERDPQQVVELLNEALGVGEGESWQATSTRDNVIATRFELRTEGYELVTNSYIPNLPQAAALVDLPDEDYGELDLYVICSHFKASGNLADILLRQRQADMVMSNVRDLLTPGDHMDFPEGTPFVILGDFNVYQTDPAAHLNTLLTGDIDNEDRYGPDFQPDWDGTALADLLPTHNGLGEETYTWRDDEEIFPRSILDRIIYPDSVLRVENAFILNTVLLSEEGLALYGLLENDVVLNPFTGYYDHLPLVADFVILSLDE